MPCAVVAPPYIICSAELTHRKSFGLRTDIWLSFDKASQQSPDSSRALLTVVHPFAFVATSYSAFHPALNVHLTQNWSIDAGGLVIFNLMASFLMNDGRPAL